MAGDGTGFMSNNSALYVTGACALSQSAYLSWGGGLNASTAVGFTQNKNGTLLFKDHASGSWTELGNSRDSTQLGDAAADVITVNGQLTASQGALFNNDVRVADDNKVYFGTGEDASIEYNNSNDRLIISGSQRGLEVSGTMYLSGSTEGRAALYISGSGPYGASGQATVIIDADKDASIIVGEAHMGNGGSTGLAYFSHKDSIGVTNAAVIQKANGSTYLNSKSGLPLQLTINGGTKLWIDSTGNVGIGASFDPTYLLDVSGSTRFGAHDTTSLATDVHQFTGSLNISGSVFPSGDDAHDLGSASKRWANVFAGDLHLKNDRGDWTILEEENYLCVVNNKTQKRYKMMLEEVED